MELSGRTLPPYVVCFENKDRCSYRCYLLSQSPGVGGHLENCDSVSLLELGFFQCLPLLISQSALEEMLDTAVAIWFGLPIPKNNSE